MKLKGPAQLWWVPIVVAVIGLVALVGSSLIEKWPFARTEDSFEYSVRVQHKDQDKYISGATITLETPEQAPLITETDSTGYARLFLDSNYAGKPGRLLIEATGYQTYVREVDLRQGDLPSIVSLEPEP